MESFDKSNLRVTIDGMSDQVRWSRTYIAIINSYNRKPYSKFWIDAVNHAEIKNVKIENQKINFTSEQRRG